MNALFRKIYRKPEARMMAAVLVVGAGILVGATWPADLPDIVALSAVFR